MNMTSKQLECCFRQHLRVLRLIFNGGTRSKSYKCTFPSFYIMTLHDNNLFIFVFILTVGIPPNGCTLLVTFDRNNILGKISCNDSNAMSPLNADKKLKAKYIKIAVETCKFSTQSVIALNTVVASVDSIS